MRVHYGSDLHLEVAGYRKALPHGDVLLLAGDITVARYLLPERQDADSRTVKHATAKLANDIKAKFTRAYMVAGNHEAYGSNYTLARGRVAHALGIPLLDNGVVPLTDRTLLFGATLWTDMDKGNPLSMLQIGGYLREFDISRKTGPWVWVGEDVTPWTNRTPFTPQMAADEFRVSLAKLDEVSRDNPNKDILVMTHHAPSHLGLNPRHSDGGVLDRGYYTPLEDLIADHPNIKYWIHGHTHFQGEYQIEQCRVYSNARGYDGWEPMAQTFAFDRSFEIK